MKTAKIVITVEVPDELTVREEKKLDEAISSAVFDSGYEVMDVSEYEYLD